MIRLSSNTIAAHLGCTHGCVLWNAHDVGVRRFWCCEQCFDYPALMKHRDRDCRGFSAWIEFEASSATLSDLAKRLEMKPEELCKS